MNQENKKEKCRQCILEGNNGICDRIDCINKVNNENADWWLAKLQEQKQQMIEKGEGLKKEYPNYKETPYADFPKEYVGYNQAITDYQNLIKEDTHICCDGECNHDDCCGKVSENCPNYKFN